MRIVRIVAACAAVAVFGHIGVSRAADHAAPITMIINQSPWLAPFEHMVDEYSKETGNKVDLDVNPYNAMLEKIRNSLRAQSGTYDLIAVDANWMTELYSAGYLLPIDTLEPGFKLDPKVDTFGDSLFWNARTRSFDAAGGTLMGLPINGNVDVLYYRTDLYKSAGLKVPDTWDELLANTAKLKNPPRTYGFVNIDDRDTVALDFANFMFSFGGSVFANPKAGDFSITLNSPQNLKALEFFIRLAKEGGYPSPGSVTQAQLFQLIATDKAVQGIGVIAAMSQFQDPSQSLVAGKLGVALIPRAADGMHASRAGHWVGAIARNVPHDRQMATLTFLKWFVTRDHEIDYTKAGGIPTRSDLADSPLGKDPKFAFLSGMAANAAVAQIPLPVPEGPQLMSVANLRLNEAVIGQTKPADALNQAAHAFYDIMKRAGYKTGVLPDLK